MFGFGCFHVLGDFGVRFWASCFENLGFCFEYNCFFNETDVFSYGMIVFDPWGQLRGPLEAEGRPRVYRGVFRFHLRSFTIIVRLLTSISRCFTAWNGFAVPKSSRIQSSILKIMKSITVYEDFYFCVNFIFLPYTPSFFLTIAFIMTRWGNTRLSENMPCY